MAIVAIVPVAHEASDGRLVVEAPAATDRLAVSVAGVPTRVRLVTRQKRNGRARITVQVPAVARAGVDLQLVARHGSRELGRAVVDDVHLVGAGAFARSPAHSTTSARASAEARRIARGRSGQIGISAECLETGRTAVADADHVAVAASTLKVAILAAALARDAESPTRTQVYGPYRAAIVQSNNDAANRVMAGVGGGSTALGARRVNALMARLGMRSSFLDGPYRLGGGASLKRTSAADLERLAKAVYLAAAGTGPLVRLGMTRHEARVLIGLMASESYPGLIRDHLPGPVAHKAGWLNKVQNDVALAFGTPGGTCLIAITTENLSFTAADAVGHDVAVQVLPLLAAPRPPKRSGAAPAITAPARTSGSGFHHRSANRAPTETFSDGFPSRWLLAGVAILVLTAAVVVRRAAVLRRRRRLRTRERTGRLGSE